MMNANANVDDSTVIIRSPGGAEIRWRTQRMVCLGADAELAAKVADSDTDCMTSSAC
jgi:hypothetical protein